MTREQMIEEMTETINELYGVDAMYFGVDSYGISYHLYENGYRKQSECERVPRNIPVNKYACAVCSLDTRYYDHNGDLARSRYCPACGTKLEVV